MICTFFINLFTDIKITDIILALASIIAAWVAVDGLSSWKFQLKGKAEYDLAKRILLGLFKLRDAIQEVRNPVMWSNEMPSPPEDKRHAMNQQQIEFHGREKAYQKRWDRVVEQNANLYPDILESEVVWGTELKKHLKEINNLQVELKQSVRRYLTTSNPDINNELAKTISNTSQSNRDILFHTWEESDNFSKDLENAIKKVEDFLKPKLQLTNRS